MDATSTKILRLRNTPINSGMEAVARSLDKAYPSLVRPHALHLSSVDPEHPVGTAIGGSLVPPISPSSWLYVNQYFARSTPPTSAPRPSVPRPSRTWRVPRSLRWQLRLPRASSCAVPLQATLTSSPLSTTRPSTPWPKSVP